MQTHLLLWALTWRTVSGVSLRAEKKIGRKIRQLVSVPVEAVVQAAVASRTGISIGFSTVRMVDFLQGVAVDLGLAGACAALLGRAQGAPQDETGGGEGGKDGERPADRA